MKPRPKLRTFCRWMLTVLAVVLAVVWIGSGWYSFESNWALMASDEAAAIDPVPGPYFLLSQGTFTAYTPRHFLEFAHVDRTIWGFRSQPQFDLILWEWRWDPGSYSRWTMFPLWLPPLLIAIPTALMWRKEIIARFRKPGMCKKCGYDITGLVGKEACPECGTKFKTDGAQASAS